jgi:hypothetical protein
MRFSKGLITLALLGLGVGSSVFAGCGGDETGKTSGTPPAGACALKDPSCLVADAECVALVDNAGAAQFGLRMSQIVISKPDSLAAATFTGKTVASGVALDMKQCFLNGQGTFSWLLYFDTASNTVCTGGAKPVTNPADGYTFVDETINQGGVDFVIKPVKFDADVSTGAFASPAGQDIVVPVYTADMSVVLLPLKKARIFDAKLSADHNCVGKFNAEGLDPFNNCGPYPEEGQFSFINSGKIDGYITLEDADDVIVELAGASLCALLTGQDDGAMPIKKCKRDAMGKIAFSGDWCDATNAAATATCADAMRLGADFAASAVKVNGGCPLP